MKYFVLRGSKREPTPVSGPHISRGAANRAMRDVLDGDELTRRQAVSLRVEAHEAPPHVDQEPERGSVRFYERHPDQRRDLLVEDPGRYYELYPDERPEPEAVEDPADPGPVPAAAE